MIGNSNAPAKKIRSLKLSPSEENHSKSFFSDESIDLVQQFPCKQFPDFVWFDDFATTWRNPFNVINAGKPSFQILHTGFAHWICVANLKRNRAHNGCYGVYDSLNSKNITAKVADKVSNNLCCRKSEIPYIW